MIKYTVQISQTSRKYINIEIESESILFDKEVLDRADDILENMEEIKWKEDKEYADYDSVIINKDKSEVKLRSVIPIRSQEDE